MPCGFNLATAADDRAVVTHLGSGVWEFTGYQRANGVPVDCSAVAMIKFGMVGDLPPLHTYAYGQALSRAGLDAYIAKATRVQSGTRTSGNATITGVANTTGFGAGMPVEGMGIADNCTITNVVAHTSITLNSSSCVGSSGTSAVRVFLTGYGTGGDKTTIGAPDCRGRTLAGFPELSGTLTSTWFGTDPNVFGAKGGSQSHTLTLAQLPSHQHDVFLKDPGHLHSFTSGGGGQHGGSGTPGGEIAGANTSNAFTGITVGSVSGVANDNKTAIAGSGSAHPTVAPTLIAECVVRVVP